MKKKCLIFIPLSFLMFFFIFGGLGQVVIAESAAGIDDLVESGEPERIATGFINTEGPVWHPDGYLLFSDINGDTIYKWSPAGKVEKFRSPSGMSNGYEGNRLNSPNDVVVKSDGSIYFTDPPYGIDPRYGKPGKKELSFQGVYRILPDGKTLELLVKDLYRPNGLAFSPDEKILYVADTQGPDRLLAFDVQPDRTLANRRNFVSGVGWPDGIKVDVKGNLYVTTNMNYVMIFDNTGKHLGNINTPEITRNCAFGGPENKTLFITAMSSVYRVKLKIAGVKVWR
jgi:sugar lactone lactonase YvrE